MREPKRKRGDVFKYSDLSSSFRLSPGYWKITMVPPTKDSDQVYGASMYSVIKCTATGKEFKRTARFNVVTVDAIPEERIIAAPLFELLGKPNKARSSLPDPVKKMSRRIKFLRSKIKNFENEISYLEMKILIVKEGVK